MPSEGNQVNSWVDGILVVVFWLCVLCIVVILVFAMLLLFGVIDLNGPVCPVGKNLILMPVGKVMVPTCV